jgi:hypothetical protein
VIGTHDANIKTTAGEAMFADLGDERIHDSQAFDGQATLATPLFAKELSRRLQARGVAVNAFHSRERRGVPRGLIQTIARYFVRSPARQAATPALLAVSPLVVGISGEFWSNCRISRGNPLFSDTGLARRLWDISAQLAAVTSGRARSPL